MSDEYEHVIKGPLRLKNNRGVKKKKNKQQKPLEEERTPPTKAEIEFQKMQEKMESKRIIERAMKTHKQRVEEFNTHLDSITEHFDIPKLRVRQHTLAPMPGGAGYANAY